MSRSHQINILDLKDYSHDFIIAASGGYGNHKSLKVVYTVGHTHYDVYKSDSLYYSSPNILEAIDEYNSI